jgi:hypothetical protein
VLSEFLFSALTIASVLSFLEDASQAVSFNFPFLVSVGSVRVRLPFGSSRQADVGFRLDSYQGITSGQDRGP